MFSGIVRDIGRVVAIDSVKDSDNGENLSDWRITIATKLHASKCALGASICCNGICLTVAEVERETTSGSEPLHFTVQAGVTTRACTTLAYWRAGMAINLEGSLSLGDSLDGHLVMGHVDSCVRLARRQVRENETELFFLFPTEWQDEAGDFSALIAPRGSIALDGVSLTLASCERNGAREFSVAIVPYTAAHTTLGLLAEGDWVNLEIDILSRYIARYVARHVAGSVARDLTHTKE